MKNSFILSTIFFALTSSIYALPAQVGQLTWFQFHVNTDEDSARVWSSLSVNLAKQTAVIFPKLLTSTHSSDYVMQFGVTPGVTTTLYFDYPDYTGKIQHGCQFDVTITSEKPGYKHANAIQVPLKNSAMVCTESGSPDSNYKITISTFAFRK